MVIRVFKWNIIAAITGITCIEIVALSNGVDGLLTNASIGAICILCGRELKGLSLPGIKK